MYLTEIAQLENINFTLFTISYNNMAQVYEFETQIWIWTNEPLASNSGREIKENKEIWILVRFISVKWLSPNTGYSNKI